MWKTMSLSAGSPSSRHYSRSAWSHVSTSLPSSLHHWTFDITTAFLILNFSSAFYILFHFAFFFFLKTLLSHLCWNLFSFFRFCVGYHLFSGVICLFDGLIYSQDFIITKVLMIPKAIFPILIYTSKFQMYIFSSLLDIARVFQKYLKSHRS